MHTLQEQHHVLVIPSWYPAFEGDVGGSFFREQALALKSAGFKVGVIYPQISSFKSLFKKNRKKGLAVSLDEEMPTYRYHFVNLSPRINSLTRKAWVKYGETLYLNYVEKYGKPDIIHVHSMLNAGLLALVLKKKYNIPFVITEHSTAFARNLIDKSVINNLKPVVANADRCIAVSNEFKDLLNTIFSVNKWFYIPNIVCNKFLSYDLNKNHILGEGEAFTFINICLLDPKKNVDLLLHAFALVQQKITNVKLVIGGNGPELDNLIDLAKALKINNKVEFLGTLSREEVLEQVSLANAFVLSSEYETFGVVLVEALALGKPLVATKCGGPESIISPEVGLLVNKNNEIELAEGMISLYEDYTQFNEQDIRDYCKKHFSEEAVVNSLTQMYREILNNDSQ